MFMRVKKFKSKEHCLRKIRFGQERMPLSQHPHSASRDETHDVAHEGATLQMHALRLRPAGED